MTPGTLIGGKYRLTRQIGSGAMGVVWAAVNESIAREVALKLILHSNEELRRRLLREGRACGGLKQRNIIEVYDVGETAEGDPFLVMQLLNGETLAEVLERQRRLDPPYAARVARDVALALVAAHGASIIHRDLKPANIFLHEETDAEGAPLKVVKVLDFGVSKSLAGEASDGLATMTGGLVGSPAYMSPEQAKATRNLDARSDLWSLGTTLFEMLTGVRPFQGDPNQLLPKIVFEPIPLVSRFVRHVDPGLVAIVSRCLERDLARRVQSASELAEMLKPYCDGIAISPHVRPAPPDHLDPPSSGARAGDPPRPSLPSGHDSGRIRAATIEAPDLAPPVFDPGRTSTPSRHEAFHAAAPVMDEDEAATAPLDIRALGRMPFPPALPPRPPEGPRFGGSSPAAPPSASASKTVLLDAAPPAPAPPWRPAAPSDAGVPQAPALSLNELKQTIKLGPDYLTPPAPPPSSSAMASGAWPASVPPTSSTASGSASTTAPLLARQPEPPAALDRNPTPPTGPGARHLAAVGVAMGMGVAALVLVVLNATFSTTRRASSPPAAAPAPSATALAQGAAPGTPVAMGAPAPKPPVAATVPPPAPAEPPPADGAASTANALVADAGTAPATASLPATQPAGTAAQSGAQKPARSSGSTTTTPKPATTSKSTSKQVRKFQPGDI